MPNKCCAICNGPLTQPKGGGRPRIYCSPYCKRKAAGAMRRPNAEPWMPAATPCAVCGEQFVPFSSRNRYCSAVCRSVHYGWKTDPTRLYSRSCQNCQATFTTRYSRKRTCSDKCRAQMGNRRKRGVYFDEGAEGRCFVYFRKCQDCGTDICTRHPGQGFCAQCVKARRSWTDAKKNHKRRGAGPIQVSRKHLIELRGNRCHICGKIINLQLSGLHPMGLTIDHLLPVSRGGTNEISNLHVAHRRCNVARGNRGHAQLILDCDAGSSAKAS